MAPPAYGAPCGGWRGPGSQPPPLLPLLQTVFSSLPAPAASAPPVSQLCAPLSALHMHLNSTELLASLLGGVITLSFLSGPASWRFTSPLTCHLSRLSMTYRLMCHNRLNPNPFLPKIHPELNLGRVSLILTLYRLRFGEATDILLSNDKIIIMGYLSPSSIPSAPSENHRLGAGRTWREFGVHLSRVLWFWGTELGCQPQQECHHPFLSRAPDWVSDGSH